MSERLYARLTRFAVYTAVHAFAGGLLLAWPDLPAFVYGVWLVAGVPLLLSIGPYQAHVTGNGALDEPARLRWRVALFFVWPIAVYWMLEVRPNRDERP